MGAIRSPYFSCGGDYLGDNAEIHSPYFSFGTRGYDGDNAEIHSTYFSVGDYHGDDPEIPSETFFRQGYNVENPYNAEQDIAQSIFNPGKLIQQKDVEGKLIQQKDVEGKLIQQKDVGKLVNIALQQQPEIFTPQEIPIGPFHQLDKKLDKQLDKQQLKEEFREAFYNRVAKKTSKSMKKVGEEVGGEFRAIIENDKEKIRQFYGFEIVDEKFLEMVLLDAAFILEYMLRSEEKTLYKYELLSGSVRFKIRSDLMLFGNQLPFFILRKLYGRLADDGKRKYTSFRLLACAYFKRHIDSPYTPRSLEKILDFTHLVRYLLSFKLPESPAGVHRENFYSATQLDKAAIKFKGVKDKGLLDIFSAEGEFTMPRLQIDSNTTRLFGNLMAFEICHYQDEEQYICHYVKLLNRLILKPRDADLLIKKDILAVVDPKNKGPEVQSIIEKLRRVEKLFKEETSEDLSCYYSLYEKLDEYYQKYWPNSFAYLRETYFGNLWRGTATVSATVLLILAFVQALCSYLALPSQYKGGVILFLLLLPSVILFVSSLFCLQYLFSQ